VIPAEFSNPSNSHNDVLEVLFNTGFLGLIPFLFMLIYSLKWMMNYSRLKKKYSADLALHAVCIIFMILVSSLIDIRLSARIDPIFLLFVFYILIIDVRNSPFHEKAQIENIKKDEK
jgi:O-antigen ligase